MTGTADRVSRSLDRIGDKAKRLGTQMSKVSAGIAAAGGGLLMLTKRSAENANQIGKAARTAGIGAEAFQEMQFAIGQMADVSDQQFGLAMQKLTRRTGFAADGQKTYQEALEKVGVTQAELASGALSTEDILRRLNKAMAEMETQAEAAAVASVLLGEEQGPKIGAAMRANAAALDEGREKAREMGLVMSGEFVQNSERMVDQFDVLSRQTEKLRADLAEKIIPILTEQLIPAIQDKVLPAISDWITKIGEIITWFQDLPGPVQEAIAVVAAAIGAGGPVLLALGVMTKAFATALAATGPIGLFIGAAALAVAAWQKWGDDIKAAVGGAIDWLVEKFNGLMAKIQGIIDKARRVKEAISSALGFGEDAPAEDGSAPFNPRTGAGRPGGAAEEGDQVAAGLSQGIGQGLADREGEIRGYIRGLPRAAREELEIESPSKVFDRIGRQIGEGLAGGIGGTAGLTRRAVGEHTEFAKMSALEATDSILGSMSQLFEGSKPIAAAQALVNTYQGITEALKLPFPGSLVAAAKVAAQGFMAVQGIKSTAPGGGGGAASGGGGGAATAAPPAALSVNASFQGDFFTRDQVQGGITDLLDNLQEEAQRRGLNLTVTA